MDPGMLHFPPLFGDFTWHIIQDLGFIILAPQPPQVLESQTCITVPGSFLYPLKKHRLPVLLILALSDTGVRMELRPMQR